MGFNSGGEVVVHKGLLPPDVEDCLLHLWLDQTESLVKKCVSSDPITWVSIEGGGGGGTPGDSVVEETSYGLAASAGDATTYSRSNHTHGSPPLGDSAPVALGTAAPGTAATPARSDHVHPLTGLALSSHNHDGVYAPSAHDHDDRYYTEAQSDATFATSGHTHSGLAPSGGTTGQVLKKNSNTNYDYSWQTDASGGGGEAFPVGSVFISVVSTNPATLLGYGTWVAFGAGRTLIGIDAGQSEFDTVEETGGSKTHTLTTAEIPAHTHAQSVNSATTGGLSGYTPDTSTNTSVTSGYSTGSTGGGGAHNNLPPFIVTYFWKRTA